MMGNSRADVAQPNDEEEDLSANRASRFARIGVPLVAAAVGFTGSLVGGLFVANYQIEDQLGVSNV